jgi:hypothetical protein
MPVKRQNDERAAITTEPNTLFRLLDGIKVIVHESQSKLRASAHSDANRIMLRVEPEKPNSFIFILVRRVHYSRLGISS